MDEDIEFTKTSRISDEESRELAKRFLGTPSTQVFLVSGVRVEHVSSESPAILMSIRSEYFPRPTHFWLTPPTAVELGNQLHREAKKYLHTLPDSDDSLDSSS